MTSKIKRGYGHIPESKTANHPKISLPKINLTQNINLVSNLPLAQMEPYDQGQLGSCTANGLAFCYVYDEIKQNNKIQFMPSRLFIYYNERYIEGTTNQDAGAQISDGVSVLQQFGVCSEEEWPYDAPKYMDVPTYECYATGSKCKALKTGNVLEMEAGVNKSTHVVAALAAGYPVILGFVVFNSFEDDTTSQTGTMSMPSPTDTVVGGHCVVIVGHNMELGFLVRNSWGNQWGCPANGPNTPRGYFWMPSAFLNGSYMANQGDGTFVQTDYCSDFWVITSVSTEGPSTGDANILLPDVINLNPGTSNGGVVNPN